MLEESQEKDTQWIDGKLHTTGMFGKHSPIAYKGKGNAVLHATRVGGKAKYHAPTQSYHIIKEEYGAGEDASTEAATTYKNDTPGQENAHIPYRKTIKTIQQFVKDKYKKKL